MFRELITQIRSAPPAERACLVLLLAIGLLSSVAFVALVVYGIVTLRHAALVVAFVTLTRLWGV